MQYQYVRSCTYIRRFISRYLLGLFLFRSSLLALMDSNNHEEYSKVGGLPENCGSFKLIREMLQIIEDHLQENDEVT